jgi:eight-cysteine-cluster-containing protein
MKFTNMIRTLCICALAMFCMSCTADRNRADASVSDSGPDTDEELGGFCGFSTGGPCSTDADCYHGGCSGQVCQSTEEDPVITTCEWRDCYDDVAYNVACGCVAGSCSWLRLE